MRDLNMVRVTSTNVLCEVGCSFVHLLCITCAAVYLMGYSQLVDVVPKSNC